jgi:hypothetical protein
MECLQSNSFSNSFSNSKTRSKFNFLIEIDLIAHKRWFTASLLWFYLKCSPQKSSTLFVCLKNLKFDRIPWRFNNQSEITSNILYGHNIISSLLSQSMLLHIYSFLKNIFLSHSVQNQVQFSNFPEWIRSSDFIFIHDQYAVLSFWLFLKLVLYCILFNSFVLYSILLYSIPFSCLIFDCIVLYCIVLYYIVLFLDIQILTVLIAFSQSCKSHNMWSKLMLGESSLRWSFLVFFETSNSRAEQWKWNMWDMRDVRYMCMWDMWEGEKASCDVKFVRQCRPARAMYWSGSGLYIYLPETVL